MSLGNRIDGACPAQGAARRFVRPGACSLVARRNEATAKLTGRIFFRMFDTVFRSPAIDQIRADQWLSTVRAASRDVLAIAVNMVGPAFKLVKGPAIQRFVADCTDEMCRMPVRA